MTTARPIPVQSMCLHGNLSWHNCSATDTRLECTLCGRTVLLVCHALSDDVLQQALQDALGRRRQSISLTQDKLRRSSTLRSLSRSTSRSTTSEEVPSEEHDEDRMSVRDIISDVERSPSIANSDGSLRSGKS